MKYILKCTKCGNDVEREFNIINPVCFDCKRQARINWARSHKKLSTVDTLTVNK